MRQHGHRSNRSATREQRNPDGGADPVGQRPGHRALPAGIVVDNHGLDALEGEACHAFPRSQRPRNRLLVRAVVGQRMQSTCAGRPPVECGPIRAQEIAGKVDREFGERRRLEDPAGRYRQLVQSGQCLRSDGRPPGRFVPPERSGARWHGWGLHGGAGLKGLTGGGGVSLRRGDPVERQPGPRQPRRCRRHGARPICLDPRQAA